MTTKNSLKEYRQHGNLTQRQLAERVDVQRETIIRIEQGKHIPSVILALRIAAELGVSVETIWKGHSHDE